MEKKTVILTRFVDTAAAVNVTAKVCDKWDELAFKILRGKCTASEKGWVLRFRNRFSLKSINERGC